MSRLTARSCMLILGALAICFLAPADAADNPGPAYKVGLARLRFIPHEPYN